MIVTSTSNDMLRDFISIIRVILTLHVDISGIYVYMCVCVFWCWQVATFFWRR